MCLCFDTPVFMLHFPHRSKTNVTGKTLAQSPSLVSTEAPGAPGLSPSGLEEVPTSFSKVYISDKQNYEQDKSPPYMFG